MGVLEKFFSVENFVKSKDLRGELPSNKEAYRTAFQMAWPSSLEMVLIGLIGSLDLIMVSHLGTASISAIGITTQPKFILMAPLLALNTGVTIVVSRRLGQKKKRRCESNFKKCSNVEHYFFFYLHCVRRYLCQAFT